MRIVSLLESLALLVQHHYSPILHDSHCLENYESQVKELKGELERETQDVMNDMGNTLPAPYEPTKTDRVPMFHADAYGQYVVLDAGNDHDVQIIVHLKGNSPSGILDGQPPLAVYEKLLSKPKRFGSNLETHTETLPDFMDAFTVDFEGLLPLIADVLDDKILRQQPIIDLLGPQRRSQCGRLEVDPMHRANTFLTHVTDISNSRLQNLLITYFTTLQYLRGYVKSEAAAAAKAAIGGSYPENSYETWMTESFSSPYDSVADALEPHLDPLLSDKSFTDFLPPTTLAILRDSRTLSHRRVRSTLRVVESSANKNLKHAFLFWISQVDELRGLLCPEPEAELRDTSDDESAESWIELGQEQRNHIS